MKKKYKIALSIFFGLVLIIFLTSLIISSIVSRKVVEMLEKQNIEHIHVSIDKTKFSLFDRSLVFSEVHLGPTDSSMVKLKNNELEKKSLHKLSFSRLKFKGIHLLPLLFSKELIINKLIIDDPLYQHFTNGQKDSATAAKKPVKLDSIHIKELSGFQLDVIRVVNLKVQVIDIVKNEITFQNTPLDFEVAGIKLDEVAENYYKLSPLKKLFEITRIKVEFPNIKYSFSIDALKYHFGEDHLQISNLKYKPMVNKKTLANSYTYNKEVYDLSIHDLKIFNLNMEKVIHNKGFFMDSIQITKLSVEIYKDKRNPFDLNKRPQLPHQKLKQMETPLLIHKISINESDMVYEEKLENKDILLKVSMEDTKVNIFNVSSIEQYREAPLKVDISTKFMGKSTLNIDMLLPLADDQNTFFFSGYLGPSEMTYYDSAIIPALGLKILKGKIESLSFQASANNFNSNGTMKFAYHDLEAEVFKPKNTEKSNFLSWSVNNLIHKSNPGKNGELREATMNFDRVIYKGFGNFLWKTLQNGLVNSMAPFGKTTGKVDAKKQRQLKREQRKKDKNDSL